MLDLDFIQRCQSKDFQEVVKEHRKENLIRSYRWRKENPEKFRESQKKYDKTEKGKVAAKRRHAIGQERVKEHVKNLDNQNKEMIRSFYANRPDGYHVDHIIPICRGGDHHIDNLQYLTPQQNLYKGRIIFWFYLPKYVEREKHLICYTIFVRSMFYLK